MIGIAKTVDEDERNDWGFPPVEVTAHEHAVQTARVAVDNSSRKNDALPWVLVAGVIGAMALGMAVATMGRVDDISSFYEQRLGAVQQQADLLTYYVMELDGKLMQRQLIKPEESFSGQQLQRSKAQQKPEQERKK